MRKRWWDCSTFTEYPGRGASLDALGGEYRTPEGTSVWLADVELEPYQALLVKNQIAKRTHLALSFCQSFQSIFSQSAESSVFSKLFVDTARFLW